ncbi:tRNA pseudouridine(55) synthase TruB [Roseiconus nitratireducens]|uniref:tRNA pseudouridine synthase B n=1 Tax=Roseiconus nitratireducens TaxID=2605748 RepID=A0A5M6D178_9BACT|nr:tRNA pseudouridine(55) synthase TruB [Roseiconus nitratireducens]KAA5540042.1 tRNA pseudouridine(55) synthase TruB [Roseiconus nitratireducens]
MFGFINCDKPVGFTSRDLVNVVQGRLRGVVQGHPRGRKTKVGHCGTLDPLADGVLLIGVGPAARLVPYVHQVSKQYIGSFRLAAESPTGDMEVEPTLHRDHPRPNEQALRDACVSLTGSIEQTPPAYSAIKIGGQRAYDLARRGKSVQVPTRTVQIDSLNVVRYDYPELTLEIVCGTGTYIRTLGMDLARAVGTTAVMTSLRRTRIGDFQLEDSVAVDRLRNEDMESLLVPAIRGVSHLPSIQVDQDNCRRLSHGLCLSPEHVPGAGELADPSEECVAVSPSGALKAILVRKSGRWCPKRVFPD